jgi:hypothetical protein
MIASGNTAATSQVGCRVCYVFNGRLSISGKNGGHPAIPSHQRIVFR